MTQSPPEPAPTWFIVTVVLWLIFMLTAVFTLVVTALILYIRRLIRCGPAAVWEPVLWFVLGLSLFSVVITTLR